MYNIFDMVSIMHDMCAMSNIFYTSDITLRNKFIFWIILMINFIARIWWCWQGKPMVL